VEVGERTWIEGNIRRFWRWELLLCESTEEEEEEEDGGQDLAAVHVLPLAQIDEAQGTSVALTKQSKQQVEEGAERGKDIQA
jgi:hypothetical protein